MTLRRRRRRRPSGSARRSRSSSAGAVAEKVWEAADDAAFDRYAARLNEARIDDVLTRIPDAPPAPGKSAGKGNGKGRNAGKGNAEDTVGLADLDTLVITDREVPRYVDADGNLVTPDREAFWDAVRHFTESGGNVVLTDRAVQGLVDMGVVAEGSVTNVKQYAGEITEIDRDHPLLEGIEGIVGQTYFEVPLG